MEEVGCEHVCSGECRRSGCNCDCGEYHTSAVELMSKEDWIAKEIAEKEKSMRLDGHNKSVLRSMKEREFNYWERQAVREDSHTGLF